MAGSGQRGSTERAISGLPSGRRTLADAMTPRTLVQRRRFPVGRALPIFGEKPPEVVNLYPLNTSP